MKAKVISIVINSIIWIGKPDLLQSLGLQRIEDDLATEQQ